MRAAISIVLAIVIAGAGIAGYMAYSARLTWQNGWTDIPAAAAEGDAVALLRNADALTNEADTQERFEAVLALQERVLDIDPMNFEALWKLSRNIRFHGQIYADGPDTRRAEYLRSIQLAERALYANPAFREAIDSGVNPWDATQHFTEADLPAMHYYFLGVFSMFLTELDDFGKLANAYWINRIKAFVARMIELDETWAGGHPYYNRALYLCQLPGFMGGDLQQAGEDLERAIEIGPRWANNYYMRARVYRTKINDREGFVRDLEFIANMDPRDSDAPFPNSSEYIRQAGVMLDNVDDWFD